MIRLCCIVSGRNTFLALPSQSPDQLIIFNIVLSLGVKKNKLYVNYFIALSDIIFMRKMYMAFILQIPKAGP